MRTIAILALFASLMLGHAAEKENTTKVIEQLLAKVSESDCKFIRNGDEHPGKEAAEHMRMKYDHVKKKITTPEQFIEKCATKSETSGKPYQIELPDGKKVPAKDWMLARLAEIRKNGASDPKLAK